MTRKQKKSIKTPLIIFGSIMIIVAVVFCVVKFTNRPEQSKIPVEEETPVAKEIEEPEKVEIENIEEEKGIAQYEGENPNSMPELSGIISSTRVSGDKLTIIANIDQFLSSGTCELTLSSGEKTIAKSADIITMVSTSTCDGFEIPISELSSGTWEINIHLISGDKEGTIIGETKI